MGLEPGSDCASVPNGILFPIYCSLLFTRALWDQVVHYIANRVLFGTRTAFPISWLVSRRVAGTLAVITPGNREWGAGCSGGVCVYVFCALR
jgi:hypothetical protein